jgi:DNA-binding Lrp family transcriptional regulator
MKQRDRIVAYLREHGPTKPAAIARATGIPGPSVRRTLQELRDVGEVARTALEHNWTTQPEEINLHKRPERQPEDTATLRERVSASFAPMGHDPAPTKENLAMVLDRGTPQLLDEIALAAWRKFRGEGRTWRPSELAWELGASRSAVSGILGRLVDSGDLVHTGRGLYSSPEVSPTDEPTADELDHWRKWLEDASGVIGWSEIRIFEDDGRWGHAEQPVIVWHSPPHWSRTKPIPGTPAAMAKRHGGRKPMLSADFRSGKMIPVLATPLNRLEILDDDRPLTDSREPPPGAIGYSETPGGVHWYRLPFRGDREDQRVKEAQDPQFVSASYGRGAWNERLFNTDGSRRPLPRFLPSAKVGSMARTAMAAHIAAWKAAQAKTQQKQLELGRMMSEDEARRMKKKG